jgi:hypothetical protein
VGCGQRLDFDPGIFEGFVDVVAQQFALTGLVSCPIVLVIDRVEGKYDTFDSIKDLFIRWAGEGSDFGFKVGEHVISAREQRPGKEARHHCTVRGELPGGDVVGFRRDAVAPPLGGSNGHG